MPKIPCREESVFCMSLTFPGSIFLHHPTMKLVNKLIFEHIIHCGKTEIQPQKKTNNNAEGKSLTI